MLTLAGLGECWPVRLSTNSLRAHLGNRWIEYIGGHSCKLVELIVAISSQL